VYNLSLKILVSSLCLLFIKDAKNIRLFTILSLEGIVHFFCERSLKRAINFSVLFLLAKDFLFSLYTRNNPQKKFYQQRPYKGEDYELVKDGFDR